MRIKANLIDILHREIYFAEVHVDNGLIQRIQRVDGSSDRYLLPGFVDSHVHIESSMLIPSEFARLAVVHGTIATVSDPHEIANVLGIDGVKYMIDNGNQVPFKFCFGAPSCVPATTHETAGASIDVDGARELLGMPDIHYLAEMMNYPGVISGDKEVLGKLQVAKEMGLPIDGHAPGVRGNDAEKYFDAGITTDHECFTFEEGLEKAKLGIKILIREGSAAKNFEALIGLLPSYKEQIMFCSDDKHPDDLIAGHINQLVARALQKGNNLFDVLQVACVNPVQHYSLPVGLLREGDPADFIVTNDLKMFTIQQTFIDGQLVAENGHTKISSIAAETPNQFSVDKLDADCFQVRDQGTSIRVIQAKDGEIITGSFVAVPYVVDDMIASDVQRDVIKIAVVNRYKSAPVAVAMIQGFKLKHGAIASCVGHDSHNILAVGVDDDSLCRAVNLVIENRGGIAAVSGNGDRKHKVLPLPVAGIMTTADGYETARRYSEIDEFTKLELGSELTAPFMTLSFMALLVIPSLKLGDQGLFDGTSFEFTSLFVT